MAQTLRLNNPRASRAARVYNSAIPSDLGELVWLRWSADALPNGPVASWVDSSGGVAAVQSDSAKRPTKDGMGVEFTGAQSLSVPFQSSAHMAHRAVVLVFRLDILSSSQSDGSILYINGNSGSSGNLQPLVGYNKTTSKITVQWRDGSSYNELSFAVSSDPSLWHCLVARRVGGVAYASLDGSAEASTGSGICLAKSTASPAGLIGDFRATSSFSYALHEVMLLQDELTQANAERLMGWGMWKVAAQSQLPSNHPYRYAPPTKVAAFSAPAYVESTPSQWQSTVDYILDAGSLESNFLGALDLSGYSLVFEDHFTSMTVVGELSAPSAGNWFSPVHEAGVGSALESVPGGSPDVWSQSGSELTITMQKSGANWYAGICTSVNYNGHGRSWKYGYFEFRAKCSMGNGFAAWPAFWVKSVNEFFRLSESRLEIDLYEGYNSDSDGHHQSIHNWPAARQKPGRVTQHRYQSNYTGLTAANGFAQTVNLFDGAYHTYGLMIDETWVKYFFDGQELGRYPTPIEAKQPVYIVIDLALLPSQAAQASGAYTMTLDYVRVYQR